MMTQPTILITGGLGCIGAETAKWLIRQTDAHLILSTRQPNPDRFARIFDGHDTSRLEMVQCDLGTIDRLESLLRDKPITHVVHMAALQSPDCNAHRDLGLQVNLAGTQNLMEAVKASGRRLERFVFASSIAVYGPRSFYPQSLVPMNASPHPVNSYGVWKLAGENLTRLFHSETSIPSISVRPGVLFGPGRDAGMTSSPTTAMKHVAVGQPFEIPFRSRQDYQYAPDVGAAVGSMTIAAFDGYGVFTLPGNTADSSMMVNTMREVAHDLGLGDSFAITIGDQEVPFICDLDFAPFCDAFPGIPTTPLKDAIAESIQVFRRQAQAGELRMGNEMTVQ